MTIWGLQDKGFLRRKKTWSYGVIDILKKFGELCSQFNNLCYKVHCNSLTFFTLEHLSRTRVHMFRKKCLILLYVTYLLLGVGKYVRMGLYIKSHWTFNRIFIFDFHSFLICQNWSVILLLFEGLKESKAGNKTFIPRQGNNSFFPRWLKNNLFLICYYIS